jgi:hypothetical protein
MNWILEIETRVIEAQKEVDELSRDLFYDLPTQKCRTN